MRPGSRLGVGDSCSQGLGRAVIRDVPMERAQRLISEHPTYKNLISGVKVSLSLRLQVFYLPNR